jgi:hypothetical protein
MQQKEESVVTPKRIKLIRKQKTKDVKPIVEPSTISTNASKELSIENDADETDNDKNDDDDDGKNDATPVNTSSSLSFIDRPQQLQNSSSIDDTPVKHSLHLNSYVFLFFETKNNFFHLNNFFCQYSKVCAMFIIG